MTEHWRTIRSALAESASGDPAPDFQRVLEALPSLGEVEAMIRAGRFRSDDVPLHLAVLRAGGSGELSSWFAAGLKSVDAATWTAALQEPDDLVALLLELSTRGAPLALGPAYQDGLAAHADAIVGADDPAPLAGTLPRLLSLLDADNRALLARSRL